jgi:hypothetical protein
MFDDARWGDDPRDRDDNSRDLSRGSRGGSDPRDRERVDPRDVFMERGSSCNGLRGGFGLTLQTQSPSSPEADPFELVSNLMPRVGIEHTRRLPDPEPVRAHRASADSFRPWFGATSNRRLSRECSSISYRVDEYGRQAHSRVLDFTPREADPASLRYGVDEDATRIWRAMLGAAQNAKPAIDGQLACDALIKG